MRALLTLTFLAATRISTSAPTLPDPRLEVPAGNELAFHLDAHGVQIYECIAGKWTFRAPEATLFDDGTEVGTHSAGPLWKLGDGSSVAATKTEALDVGPTGVPWLLLRAGAHEGPGRMQGVTWVQRLDTVDGLPPATGCDVEHHGRIARVPYSAKYYFYTQTAGSCATSP